MSSTLKNVGYSIAYAGNYPGTVKQEIAADRQGQIIVEVFNISACLIQHYSVKYEKGIL